MSVTNGQKINAAVTNAAFVSKTTDSTVVSKVTLNKSGSGTTIADVQQVINKALDTVGTTEADATPNNYSSSNFITNGDNRKVAIGKLDTQLSTTNTVANTAASTNTTQDSRLTTIESGNTTISGNKTFSGNVTFSGTTTSVNTTDLDVIDKNITVNKSGSDASSEGAGITVDRVGTKGSLIYKAASVTKFAIGNLGSEVNLVDESTTQILSNKQSISYDYIEQGSDPVNPGSGLRRLYAKSDGFYERTSGGTINRIGSGGSGGGVINLIANGDAETAVASIFVPYADAASARPVDGTGGSPTVTTSLNTGGILSGNNTYLLTKPASNCQGQGFSAPIAVPTTYKAKSLKISIDYIRASGTFVAGSSSTDSDIIWYIYDVTNSQLIEPSNIKMFASTSSLADKFEATFQTSATGTVYRLIAHVATTSTLAYEIAVDNVTVTPQVYVYGSPITDEVAYTTTLSNNSNVTINKSTVSRRGDRARIAGFLTWTGTGAGGAFTVSLPAGLNIDTNKTQNNTSNILGFANFQDSGVDNKITMPSYSTTNTIAFLREGVGLLPGTAFTINDTLAYVVEVPIVGWSSSVQMSDSADTRVVDFVGAHAASTQALTANVTNIAFSSTLKDSHGAWTGTTYVVRSAGDYYISATVYSAVTAFISTAVFKNGTSNRILGTANAVGVAATGTTIMENLVAGDIISVRTEQTATLAADNRQSISIAKIQGTQVIASSEAVNCRYSNTAGTAIGTSNAVLPFATRSWDTHLTYNTTTGELTASVSGKYRVNVKCLTTTLTLSITQNIELNLYKNGSFYSNLSRTIGTGGANTYPLNGVDDIDLLAGDKLSIFAISLVATSLSTTAGYNYLTVWRLQ